MERIALPHGQGRTVANRMPPMAGIVIGAGLSLILWAVIATLVLLVA